MKMTVKNRSQHIRSEKMVDQLSSEIIGAIAIYIPTEDNMNISRDSQLAFVLHQLEEYEVQNMDKKEQMIIRDGAFATMIQQKEEDKAQKLMDKEQRDMTSTPTRMDLLLFQRVLFLHHLLQSYIPHNLGVASKVTTLAMDSTFFFADRLLNLQAVFIVTEKNSTVDIGYHYTNSLSLGMICTNALMKPEEMITNIVTKYFSGLPNYDIWSLGCILYRLLFGSPLCNFDSQQTNSLLSVFIYHCFHLFVIL